METFWGILVVGAMAALFVVLSGVRRRRIQPQLDDFARAFCRVSDHLLGTTQRFGVIAVESAGGDMVRVLPAEAQPVAFCELLERGVDEYAMECLRDMFRLRAEAQAHLTSINLIGKRINGVLNHVYDMTNVSLSVLHDRSVPLKKEEWESVQLFFNSQAYIRSTTLASVVSDPCKKEIAR